MRIQRPTKSQRNKFLFVLLITLVHMITVSAQTTTFTYQGRLTDGGTSANATYDMQFKLFDTNGTQLGSTITQSTVTVTNGVFTVMLDYGAAAFSGNDRLLEISIRPAGSGTPYTTLSPRQPITSTPYAIRAVTTTTADTSFNATKLGGVNADQYVLTTDPRLAGGANNFIQNSNVQQAGANFNIGGNGNIAGLFSASQVNANQYSVSGARFISAPLTNNTVIGENAGASFNAQSQPQDNTLVGTAAGNKIVGGKENTIVGSLAGAAVTSGDGNSFFGFRSGRNVTSGTRNAFFGDNTGVNSLANHQNSFFGSNAGRMNSSERNSFFGEQAGRENTEGFENSFYGASAGRSNLTGNNNSFFGYSAGEANTTANNNSFFGVRAGWKNTTGSENTFFGLHAGHTNVTGSDNAYFGTFAGTLSTGSSNAFFGRGAGDTNGTGFANAFFGMKAGDQNETGFNNAFFGRGAGAANVGGSSNTIVGAFADFTSANLNFATAIGSGATVGASNTIVLGRSNGSDAVVVPGTLAFNTLGTIGIGGLCRNALNQLAACSSSLRYKKDLAPFKGGLALLNSLKPITFTWKSDNSRDLGFGAEDVAAVEPLLVVRNDMGQVEGVKYDRITAVLVNAVKEQQAQIAQQQQLLQRQQAEIQTLKRLVYRRRSTVRR